MVLKNQTETLYLLSLSRLKTICACARCVVFFSRGEVGGGGEADSDIKRWLCTDLAQGWALCKATRTADVPPTVRQLTEQLQNELTNKRKVDFTQSSRIIFVDLAVLISKLCLPWPLRRAAEQCPAGPETRKSPRPPLLSPYPPRPLSRRPAPGRPADRPSRGPGGGRHAALCAPPRRCSAEWGWPGRGHSRAAGPAGSGSWSKAQPGVE